MAPTPALHPPFPPPQVTAPPSACRRPSPRRPRRRRRRHRPRCSRAGLRAAAASARPPYLPSSAPWLRGRAPWAPGAVRSREEGRTQGLQRHTNWPQPARARGGSCQARCGTGCRMRPPRAGHASVLGLRRSELQGPALPCPMRPPPARRAPAQPARPRRLPAPRPPRPPARVRGCRVEDPGRQVQAGLQSGPLVNRLTCTNQEMLRPMPNTPQNSSQFPHKAHKSAPSPVPNFSNPTVSDAVTRDLLLKPPPAPCRAPPPAPPAPPPPPPPPPHPPPPPPPPPRAASAAPARPTPYPQRPDAATPTSSAALSRAISPWNSRNIASLGSSLTRGLLVMDLARRAYLAPRRR
jgi:hypothetical protein